MPFDAPRPVAVPDQQRCSGQCPQRHARTNPGSSCSSSSRSDEKRGNTTATVAKDGTRLAQPCPRRGPPFATMLRFTKTRLAGSLPPAGTSGLGNLGTGTCHSAIWQPRKLQLEAVRQSGLVAVERDGWDEGRGALRALASPGCSGDRASSCRERGRGLETVEVGARRGSPPICSHPSAQVRRQGGLLFAAGPGPFCRPASTSTLPQVCLASTSGSRRCRLRTASRGEGGELSFPD